jgi:PAS domain S-box-containing protein
MSSNPGDPAATTSPGTADAATLWEAVCRTTGEFIAVVDRDCVIRSCNRVDDGFTMDQVVGHDISQFTMPESSAHLRRAVGDVFATGELAAIETTVRRLNGELNYFSLRLGPVGVAGRVTAVIVCCQSILPLKTSQHELERERHVLRQLIEVQERERQLVSYDIHDGLAQYVAGALMHLRACQHAGCPAPADRELEQAIRLLESAVTESRRLIGGLRPPALDELGITAAVESLVADARADIPQVSYEHAMEGRRLPPEVETTIFRVVQEALTNARKYAHARSADVSLSRTPTSVRVRVGDDGTGFDPARVPPERFGLEGIRQRCRLLGAEPRIESSPGRGTTIEVALPLESRDG